jgi:DNA-binding SARP family transcriptional activator
VTIFSVCLLGRLSVQRNNEDLISLEGKLQELFAYLVLHRNRPQFRETLAGKLWGNTSSDQARRYLRHALWQLQTSLDSRQTPADEHLLRTDTEWIGLNPAIALSIDVEALEQAEQRVQGIAGSQLDEPDVQALESAVALYRGDLMEGCYLDWCLYERERLQQVYLGLVDKLMDHCEARQECDAGLHYGMKVLRIDRASERTHRRMMRLHLLAGDRTAALHQYQRCAVAMEEELGVRPGRRTQALYEQICSNTLDDGILWAPAKFEPASVSPHAEMPNVLDQLLASLSELQTQVRQQSQDLGSLVQRLS